MGSKLTRYLIGLCILISLISGCSKDSKDSKEVLRVAIRTSPMSLDPRIATDADGMKIADLIFDGLFEKGPDLQMRPALASSYEQVSPTVYKFFLRKDVRFHNGEPFTSKDVIYTYESIIDGSIKSPFQGGFSRIKKMEALDEHTVRIELKEPYSPFITLLKWGIVPASAKKYLETFTHKPVGTGPYKFVSLTPEISVILEANEDYFAKKPKTKRLEFEVIKDDNIRALKLMKGEIDLVQNAIPAVMLKKLMSEKNIKMKTAPGIVVAYMGLNLTDPILRLRRVRQAIAYGIDRDEIIKHRFEGYASKASSLLAPMNWAYDKNLKPYVYDPEKAKKLLKDAGFGNTKIKLSYKTSTSKNRIAIANLIAHQLGKIGLNVEVESYEWGTFFNDVKRGNFQLYTLLWTGIIEPDIYYDVLSSTEFPPKGLNRDRYKNPIINKLVSEGRTTLDLAKRKKIYDKVQQIALRDLPFIPLWYEDNIVLYRSGLEGVTLMPDASYRVLINIKKR